MTRPAAASKRRRRGARGLECQDEPGRRLSTRCSIRLEHLPSGPGTLRRSLPRYVHAYPWALTHPGSARREKAFRSLTRDPFPRPRRPCLCTHTQRDASPSPLSRRPLAPQTEPDLEAKSHPVTPCHTAPRRAAPRHTMLLLERRGARSRSWECRRPGGPAEMGPWVCVGGE
ncbi:hypothetical protein BDY21DRAFT_866 [Lineolata rhizophorae]|uniref:Uncharacterized protein n=1 Tax=Lineolata rhizophorae TaxID=578093 RepID=A0A6A6PEF8_9PEZI|nr:hypothetical protein BDY21DRAFT_866 [Lineolata rhizophorae]